MKKELEKLHQGIPESNWALTSYKKKLKLFLDNLCDNLQRKEQEIFAQYTLLPLDALEKAKNRVNKNPCFIVIYENSFPVLQTHFFTPESGPQYASIHAGIISILKRYNYSIEIIKENKENKENKNDVVDKDIECNKGKEGIRICLSEKVLFNKNYAFNAFGSNKSTSLMQINQRYENKEDANTKAFANLSALINHGYWEGKTTYGFSIPDGIQEMRTGLKLQYQTAYRLLRSIAKERLEMNYCSFFVRRDPMAITLYTALKECKQISQLDNNKNFNTLQTSLRSSIPSMRVRV